MKQGLRNILQGILKAKLNLDMQRWEGMLCVSSESDFNTGMQSDPYMIVKCMNGQMHMLDIQFTVTREQFWRHARTTVWQAWLRPCSMGSEELLSSHRAVIWPELCFWKNKRIRMIAERETLPSDMYLTSWSFVSKVILLHSWSVPLLSNLLHDWLLMIW